MVAFVGLAAPIRRAGAGGRVCGVRSGKVVARAEVRNVEGSSERANKGLDPEDEDVFVMEQEEENENFLELTSPKLFRMSSTSSVSSVSDREPGRSLGWTDLILVLSLVALVYGFVTASMSVMTGPYVPIVVSTEISLLPWYTVLSTTRVVLGYAISLVFAIGYAYVAYRVKFAAKALVLIIDILQSIPLLSFLPGVVLSLMALFPGQRIGVELAAMLLLFTSMAWNMVLGFYQSLGSIPRELQEASSVFRLSSWKKFWTLELPAGAVGLVWNSIVSVAGGWFFLISIESFELGDQSFRLPGIGAFLAAAAETADYAAITWGLASLVTVIVLADFTIWRPLIAWSSKFTYGTGQDADSTPKSSVLSFLQRSSVLRTLHEDVLGPIWDRFVDLRPLKSRSKPAKHPSGTPRTTQWFPALQSAAQFLFFALFFSVSGYAGYRASLVLSHLSVQTWLSLGVDALYTLGRVVLALGFSILWTVPLGVAVGRDPKLAQRLQPLVQILASVPATALFPFVLLALVRAGNGLQIGSILLMMLGTMWYILFNVIAGAQAIPRELFEVDQVYGRGCTIRRWRTLILPGIFPYLITGIVSAVGGAWNASIVSEYVVFQGSLMQTRGLGAAISHAASIGDYSLLLAGTLVMCGLVLLTNRFIWSPLYRLAETKYKIVQS